MQSVTLFLVGVASTAAISSAVVWYLKPYLQPVLVDLCGTNARAAFWTAFSNVTIGLTPIIFAMHYRPDPGPNTAAVFEIGTQIEWALAGLLFSVVLLGMVLSRFITKGAN
jgi:hypothetical protein